MEKIYYIKAYNADNENDQNVYYFFSNGAIINETAFVDYKLGLKTRMVYALTKLYWHPVEARSLANPLTWKEAETIIKNAK